MRFGIALPASGALGAPAALSAAAAAAEELGYSSVWPATVPHLLAVAAATATAPLAVETGAGRVRAAALGDVPAAWRERLVLLAGPAADLEVAAPHLSAATTLLLVGPPPAGAAAAVGRLADLDRADLDRADLDRADLDRADLARAAGGPLVVRLGRVPDAADLRRATALGAVEIVVSLPGATGLDDLLAGYADAAERVLAPPTGVG